MKQGYLKFYFIQGLLISGIYNLWFTFSKPTINESRCWVKSFGYEVNHWHEIQGKKLYRLYKQFGAIPEGVFPKIKVVTFSGENVLLRANLAIGRIGFEIESGSDISKIEYFDFDVYFSSAKSQTIKSQIKAKYPTKRLSFVFYETPVKSFHIFINKNPGEKNIISDLGGQTTLIKGRHPVGSKIKKAFRRYFCHSEKAFLWNMIYTKNGVLQKVIQKISDEISEKFIGKKPFTIKHCFLDVVTWNDMCAHCGDVYFTAAEKNLLKKSIQEVINGNETLKKELKLEEDFAIQATISGCIEHLPTSKKKASRKTKLYKELFGNEATSSSTPKVTSSSLRQTTPKSPYQILHMKNPFIKYKKPKSKTPTKTPVIKPSKPIHITPLQPTATG